MEHRAVLANLLGNGAAAPLNGRNLDIIGKGDVMMKYFLSAAMALFVTAGASGASTYTYDFQTEANASGKIGEAIFSTFNTSKYGVFAGPNLEITAENMINEESTNPAYVYFDNGDAGMGVCNIASNHTLVDEYAPGSGGNRCAPSSDDGLTTTGEILKFKATETSVLIKSIFINSNHDGETGILSSAWSIGGTIYDITALELQRNADGDVEIVVNYFLNFGETMSLFGTRGPNAYISAISLDPVPLPAAGLLMLGGIGAFGALRARKRKTA